MNCFSRRILQHLQAQPVAPPNTSVGSSTFGPVSSIYPGTNPRLIQVRTEIHVLALQAHGLAVQAYPSRAIFPGGTVIAHSHFSPRNPHASRLGLANFRVLKYNLHCRFSTTSAPTNSWKFRNRSADDPTFLVRMVGGASGDV